jgi:hypothetical protein
MTWNSKCFWEPESAGDWSSNYIYSMIFSFQTGGVNFTKTCQNSVAAAFAGKNR